jgi:hypothetical protein
MRRHHRVRVGGHGARGVDRAVQPDGADDGAGVPRPARRVRGAAHLPLRLRRAAHGPAAARSVTRCDTSRWPYRPPSHSMPLTTFPVAQTFINAPINKGFPDQQIWNTEISPTSIQTQRITLCIVGTLRSVTKFGIK